jgi:hypothetical protein
VDHIINNTSMVIGGNPEVAGTLPGYIGKPSLQTPMHIWIGTGGSGTGVWASTQRTTPLVSGVVGYASNYRRIGSFIYGSGNILPFDQTGPNNERTYQYENDSSTFFTNVLHPNNVFAAWTTVTNRYGIPVLPSTATSIKFAADVSTNGGVNAGNISFRKRGAIAPGSTGGRSFGLFIGPTANMEMVTSIWCDCDGAQAIEYYATSGTSCYLWPIGYRENV